MSNLIVKIQKFLKTRRQSNGGYAKVTRADLEQLNSIFQELIELKFEADPDGDVPVEFLLVNRHTHHRLHYRPVPYDDKGSAVNLFRVLMLNQGVAYRDLEMFARLQENKLHAARDKRKRKRGP